MTLKGTINLQATMTGNAVTFPLVEFDPKEPGVEKVEIEAPNADNIRTTVHFTAAPSAAEAEALAMKVTTSALDRLSFEHLLAIEHARLTAKQLSPVDPRPGVIEVEAGSYVLVGYPARLVHGLTADRVRTELERVPTPGEQYYGFFRSARLSASPVEEFMLLYSLLLMLRNDLQADVDAFIQGEEPAVPMTPSQNPRTPGRMETVYTRLRNELGHRRPGISLDRTLTAMAERVSGLRVLTKRAIELHP